MGRSSHRHSPRLAGKAEEINHRSALGRSVDQSFENELRTHAADLVVNGPARIQFHRLKPNHHH
jgi:hypothetical protein